MTGEFTFLNLCFLMIGVLLTPRLNASPKLSAFCNRALTTWVSTQVVHPTLTVTMTPDGPNGIISIGTTALLSVQNRVRADIVKQKEAMTQAQLLESPKAKVLDLPQAVSFQSGAKTITITAGSYIIDGNHTLYAAAATSREVSIIRGNLKYWKERYGFETLEDTLSTLFQDGRAYDHLEVRVKFDGK